MESGRSINFKLSARKEFHQFDDRAKAEAKKAIADLAEDPFPEGSIELRGHPGLYRVRFCREWLSHRVQRFRKATESGCPTGPPAWLGLSWLSFAERDLRLHRHPHRFIPAKAFLNDSVAVAATRFLAGPIAISSKSRASSSIVSLIN